MGYFLVKTLVTAFIVAAISELARRYTLWSAVFASLPLTSILAFIWIYADTKDPQKIIELSYSVFWLVLLSLAFFLILPFLLKSGIKFATAISLSAVAMIALYGVGIWLYKLSKG
jgi:hypothetical protein